MQSSLFFIYKRILMDENYKCVGSDKEHSRTTKRECTNRSSY